MPKCSVCGEEKESRAGLCKNTECKMSRPAAERQPEQQSKKAKVKAETGDSSRPLRSGDWKDPFEKRFKNLVDKKLAPLECPALKETLEGIKKEIKEEHEGIVYQNVGFVRKELEARLQGAREQRDTAEEMADLQKKKVSELKAYAVEQGVSEDDINEALDADVPKDALIALILKGDEED